MPTNVKCKESGYNTMLHWSIYSETLKLDLIKNEVAFTVEQTNEVYT